MKKAAIILIAFVALVALSACEPKSTVTATVGPRDCLNQEMTVTGKVDPPNATKKVVLQRTVGGKWVDFSWYQTGGDSGEVKVVRTAAVNSSGGYYFYVPDVYSWTWERLSGTIHFRVRTEGNGGISPSWYTTFEDC